MDKRPENLIVVLGPTATGKTRFAALLAHLLQGEIISADSRQVYRQMDLGTGKDYDDYQVADTTVPAHLMDICAPGEKYNVYQYQEDFNRVFAEIQQRDHIPILCGGTGMYIDAVTRAYHLPKVERNEALRAQLEDKTLAQLQEILSGYKPLHNRSDTDTRQRALRAIEIQEYCRLHPLDTPIGPALRPCFLGMHIDPERCRVRIAKRLDQRFQAGLVAEVQGLLTQGLTPEDLIYYGLEYKLVTRYITNEISYDNMVRELYTAICQFAKRQRTWFRKMERNGTKIHWIDAMLDDTAKVKQAMKILRESDSNTA
jgi:tRNA dimethylallyltransferase